MARGRLGRGASVVCRRAWSLVSLVSLTSAAALLLSLLATPSGRPGRAAAAEPPSFADRQAWRAIMTWPDDCERDFVATHAPAMADGGGLQFYALTPGRQLVQVSCAVFAYQGAQAFLIWDETATPPVARPLDFAGTAASPYNTAPEDGDAGPSSVVLGLADFDADTAELQVLTRFRGAGDCGALASYAITPDGAHLRRLRLQETCDGSTPDPAQWPDVTLDRPIGGSSYSGAAPSGWVTLTT